MTTQIHEFTYQPTEGSILGLYPNGYGFGYAYLDEKGEPQAHMRSVRNKKDDSLFTKMKQELVAYQPDILVLKEPKEYGRRSSKRITEAIQHIKEFAQECNVTVHQYTRDQVEGAFYNFGVRTKFERAQLMAQNFFSLEGIAPQYRKAWMPESFTMGAFDALGLILTHLYLSE